MSELHYVDVTSSRDADGDGPVATLECHGGTDADCRFYPDCSCTEWDEDHGDLGPGHELVHHDECYLQARFEAGQHMYEERYESDSSVEHGLPDGLNRRGPILYDRTAEGISWEYMPSQMAAAVYQAELTSSRR